MIDVEHHYKLSELLAIAEKQTADAKREMQAGEPEAAERYQQWSDTLAALQYMQEHGVPESLKDQVPN